MRRSTHRKKPFYCDSFDADEQISAEEQIAGYLSNVPEISESAISDEKLGDLGREILRMVLLEFRPDLFVKEK